MLLIFEFVLTVPLLIMMILHDPLWLWLCSGAIGLLVLFLAIWIGHVIVKRKWKKNCQRRPLTEGEFLAQLSRTGTIDRSIVSRVREIAATHLASVGGASLRPGDRLRQDLLLNFAPDTYNEFSIALLESFGVKYGAAPTRLRRCATFGDVILLVQELREEAS